MKGIINLEDKGGGGEGCGGEGGGGEGGGGKGGWDKGGVRFDVFVEAGIRCHVSN